MRHGDKNAPVPGSRMVDRVPVRGVYQDWPSRTVRYNNRNWRGPVLIRAPGVVFNIRYVGLHEHAARGAYPMHTHPYSEFLFTLEGRGDIHIPDRKRVEPCAPGHLVVIPSGVAHQTRWNNPSGALWRILVVDFDIAVDAGALLVDAGEQVDLAFSPFYELFFVRGHPALHLSPTAFEGLRTQLDDLTQSIEEPHYGVCSEIVATLIRIVALFSKTIRDTKLADGLHATSPASSKEAALLRARSMMECDGDLDAGCVARIARAVGMSESHFIREFKRAFALTPKQYSLGVVMRRAGALLAGTDVTVKDAAYRLGYEDASSFTRAFTRYHGLSPSAFQQKRRRSAPNA